ncbi:PEP-CTERM sorting domain-containing protein [Congregibacter sp.]|uniref:PEP-CTERM sorting domain-containing protein n=1 Tax=Congregibacter sp. TaxID=2744308 RepID=UPI00385F2A6E
MFGKVITGILVFGLATSAHAGLINLVQNGEFSDTAINPAKWNPTEVAHWDSSEGEIEIWNESFQWGTDLGSDGLATGQHAEITWKTDKSEIWTTFVIPEWFAAGSTAHFSFDYQNRKSSGILASVNVNGKAATPFSVSSDGSWQRMSTGIDGLVSGDNVQLLFRSQGGGSSGAHIDQVEFNVAVPVPGTVALLGLGLAGLGFSRRKTA